MSPTLFTKPWVLALAVPLSPHHRQSHKEKSVEQYTVYTLYSSVQQSLSLYYHRSKAAIIIIRTQTNQTRNLQNPQTHAQNKILSRVCGLIIPMCSRGTNEKYDVAGVVCFSSNKIREFLRRFIDPRSSDNNK